MTNEQFSKMSKSFDEASACVAQITVLNSNIADLKARIKLIQNRQENKIYSEGIYKDQDFAGFKIPISVHLELYQTILKYYEKELQKEEQKFSSL